jgi:hypothetical protein
MDKQNDVRNNPALVDGIFCSDFASRLNVNRASKTREEPSLGRYAGSPWFRWSAGRAERHDYLLTGSPSREPIPFEFPTVDLCYCLRSQSQTRVFVSDPDGFETAIVAD